MTEGKHTLGSYSGFNDAICKHYHALYSYNALPCFFSYPNRRSCTVVRSGVGECNIVTDEFL